MSTAIQKAPDSSTVSHRAGRAIIIAEALTQEADQRKLLGEYVRSHMIEGTDFGTVPGTKNKTLLKPGAEKLTQLYRCIPRFTIEEKIENWDTGLFYYRFSCQVVTQADDAIVAEGVGSCSTYESRYRWRNSGRKCPNCGAEAIQRSKYTPKDDPDAAPGWYCFSKKGGCGAQFFADDDEIVGQQTGRVQNPDLLDAVNTVLKMAKKRALVDAAIALARCSDIFTQDLEDQVEGDSAPADDRPKRQQQPQQKNAPRSILNAAEAEKRLHAQSTPDQLKTAWDQIQSAKDDFTTAEWKKLGAIKDECKAKFSKPQAPAPTTSQPQEDDSEGEDSSDPIPF